MSNIKAGKDINDSKKGTVVLLNHYRQMRWKRDALKTHAKCELTSGWSSMSEGLDWLMEFAPEGKRKQYEAYTSRLVDYQTLLDTIDECVKKLGTCPKTGSDYESIIRYKFMNGEVEPSDDETMDYIGLYRRKYFKFKKEAIEILAIFIWTAIDEKFTGQ